MHTITRGLYERDMTLMLQLLIILPSVSIEASQQKLTFMLMTSFGQYGFNSSGLIPAADMALEDINNNPHMLPGYTLEYDVLRDSQVSHLQIYMQVYCCMYAIVVVRACIVPRAPQYVGYGSICINDHMLNCYTSSRKILVMFATSYVPLCSQETAGHAISDHCYGAVKLIMADRRNISHLSKEWVGRYMMKCACQCPVG